MIEKIEELKLEQQYYKKYNHDSIINVDKYKFKDSQALINYITRYQDDTKEKKFTLFLWLKLIFKYGFKMSLIQAQNRDKIMTSLEYKFYSLKLNELSQELEDLKKSLNDNKLDELNSEYKALSKNFLDYYISKNIDFSSEFTQKDYKKKVFRIYKKISNYT